MCMRGRGSRRHGLANENTTGTSRPPGLRKRFLTAGAVRSQHDLHRAGRQSITGGENKGEPSTGDTRACLESIMLMQQQEVYVRS